MIIAIRIRGRVGVRKQIADTLALLRLRRKMHAVLLPDNKSIKGMLRVTRDWLTWGTISDDNLEARLKKRGRKPGNKKLSADEVKLAIEEIKHGKKISALGIKPVFRLTPPSGGFKNSIKQHWPKGELGDRGEKINELLKRMI
ncbi:MAG: 50S ribosomal protein L30 [Candidatus Aenigmatarchaeota archaeon]